MENNYSDNDANYFEEKLYGLNDDADSCAQLSANPAPPKETLRNKSEPGL